MKKKQPSLATATLILFIVILLAGCAAPRPQKKRFFWPALPDNPKIEHLGTYQTSGDFPKEEEVDRTLKMLFGEDATQGGLQKPWGIASDGEGKVFITDAAQSSIVIFDMKNRTIDGLIVDGPYGIAIDEEGKLFVTSGTHNAGLIYGADGTPLKSFGEGIIKGPAGIAINDSIGLIYVADTRAHDIKVFNKAGDFLFTIGRRGSGNGEFNFPTDVDINSKGELVVADSMNARIQVLDGEGNFIRAFGRRGSALADFKIMKAIAVDSEDHIYVTDSMNHHFKIFSMKGELLLIVGGPSTMRPGIRTAGGFSLPMDIYIDKNDTIYVVDQMHRAFQVFQYLNKRYLRRNPIKR